MNHLRPEEMTEALEGALPAAQQAHLETCTDCQAGLAQFHQLLAEARDVPEPEPSPLFWDRFPERVRAAIDAHSPTGAISWVWVNVAAAVLLVAIVLAVAVQRDRAVVHQVQRQTAIDGRVEVDEPTGHDWELMLTVADETDWDTANEAGLDVRPGGADAAVALLSEAEQRELERLLRAELNEPVS